MKWFKNKSKIVVKYDGTMHWRTTRDLIDNVMSNHNWDSESMQKVRVLIKRNRKELIL